MRFPVLPLTVIGAVLLSAPVSAQNINSIEARMDRMEREMQTLSRSVFKGDVPPPSATGGSSVDSRQAAQMEVRMNQIEEQLRRVTGMVEENSYHLRKLSEQLANTSAATVPAQHTQYQNDSYSSGDIKPIDTANMPDNEVDNAPYRLGTLNGNDTSMTPAKMYDQAFSYLQTHDYASAQATFENFIKTYPDHSLAANAKYWLGETFYARGDYADASRAFARSFKDHPDGQKAPDTLLKLAMSLKGQNMVDEACLTLGELANRFPNAPVSIKEKAIEERQSYGCSN